MKMKMEEEKAGNRGNEITHNQHLEPWGSSGAKYVRRQLCWALGLIRDSTAQPVDQYWTSPHTSLSSHVLTCHYC